MPTVGLTVHEGEDFEEQDREEDENNPPMATLTGGVLALPVSLNQPFLTRLSPGKYVFCRQHMVLFRVGLMAGNQLLA